MRDGAVRNRETLQAKRQRGGEPEAIDARTVP